MDTVKSFKGYGKVDPQEEQAFRRKTRKRLLILIVSLVVLAALIVGVVVGTVTRKKNRTYDVPSTPATAAASLKSVCTITTYPDSCYSALGNSSTTDPEKLFQISLDVVLTSLEKLSGLPQEWMKKIDDANVRQALGVCQAVLDDAIDMVNDSISSMNQRNGEKLLTTTKVNDLRTWLSTTLTDQETCLDALAEVNATIIEDVKLQMKNSTEYASNSLAIVSKILSLLSDFNIPIHRKLLGRSSGSSVESGFPEWMRAADRKLLQTANPKPDVTVAKDGSGDVTTLSAAVAMVPKKSTKRFVIYVKAGEYQENVTLDKSLWNVMMYGDGKNKSIITSNLNFVDGVKTFFTATFGVAGTGFIARDMGFKNTAGAIKQQAVALRSSSDHSVFFRCSFDGFQDTLYAHSNRQFYRECDITGTIDFIFGNAAVVFQDCNILPRQPLPNQFVTITAQGKKDPNQNTGISVHNCNISPLDNLTAPTYLGRPWKAYSTTVIMNSEIGGFLNPQGWIEWVQNVVPPSTIFYAEYENTGPGSSVSQRIKWSGYRSSLSANQASMYTVQSFIDGDQWLPETNVEFN